MGSAIVVYGITMPGHRKRESYCTQPEGLTTTGQQHMHCQKGTAANQHNAKQHPMPHQSPVYP
jgi:hypothetical protein